MMEERLNLSEFLLLVEAGEIDRLTAFDYIEKATENFRSDKLIILIEEISFHIFTRKEYLLHSHSGRIKELIHQFHQQGKELPYKEVKFDPKFNIEPQKILDTDKLLGGAISWELYPLYELKKDVIAKLPVTPKPAPATHRVKLGGTPKEFSFAHCLTEEGQKLLPILLELYSHVRFKWKYVPMLFALKELGYLLDETFSRQDQLHRAIKATFPAIGTRQNFVKYLQDYSTPNTAEKVEIDLHKQRLLEAIRSGAV